MAASSSSSITWKQSSHAFSEPTDRRSTLFFPSLLETVVLNWNSKQTTVRDLVRHAVSQFKTRYCILNPLLGSRPDPDNEDISTWKRDMKFLRINGSSLNLNGSKLNRFLSSYVANDERFIVSAHVLGVLRSDRLFTLRTSRNTLPSVPEGYYWARWYRGGRDASERYLETAANSSEFEWSLLFNTHYYATTLWLFEYEIGGKPAYNFLWGIDRHAFPHAEATLKDKVVFPSPSTSIFTKQPKSYSGRRNYPMKLSDYQLAGAPEVKLMRGHLIDHVHGDSTTTSSRSNYIPEQGSYLGETFRKCLVRHELKVGEYFAEYDHYEDALQTTVDGTLIPSGRFYVLYTAANEPKACYFIQTDVQSDLQKGDYVDRKRFQVPFFYVVRHGVVVYPSFEFGFSAVFAEQATSQQLLSKLKPFLCLGALAPEDKILLAQVVNLLELFIFTSDSRLTATIIKIFLHHSDFDLLERLLFFLLLNDRAFFDMPDLPRTRQFNDCLENAHNLLNEVWCSF